MKIRKGFVSNSSSSSFVCYGTGFDEEDIYEYIKNMFNTDKKFRENILKYEEDKNISFEDLAGGGLDEMIYDIDLPNDLTACCCYDGDYLYIGKEYTKMRDNETYGEFKKSTDEAVRLVLNKKDIKCGHIEEVWQG